MRYNHLSVIENKLLQFSFAMCFVGQYTVRQKHDIHSFISFTALGRFSNFFNSRILNAAKGVTYFEPRLTSASICESCARVYGAVL